MRAEGSMQFVASKRRGVAASARHRVSPAVTTRGGAPFLVSFARSGITERRESKSPRISSSREAAKECSPRRKPWVR
jgi:hypothetical protein